LHDATVHAPLAQPEVPLATTPQTLPHDPQLFTSVRPSISQPVDEVESQLRKPEPHDRPQVDELQTDDEFGPETHTLPHAPQLFVSPEVGVSQPLAGLLSQSE
jgi:hypothetical protein